MINITNSASSGAKALKLAALATVATSALTSPVLEEVAHAQELQPVVDVCTGITLPRSAVTEVIGAVNQPIVDQIETTVNDLTTVTLILSPLANITDLDIDLTTILANAEAGDPISLQILDTNGNVISASDDCNVVADAYTLDGQSGIEIGGNQITGLGADGQTATAGELDAIAFGNNANTSVGATGAVAIGSNASATAANSVALGADSIADRPGTVSVGALGSERQIVNVADGMISDTSTDAVNGSQLFATNQAVAINATDIATLDGRVTVNEGDIANLQDLSVMYDDATQTSVTLGGAGGTTLTNVAPGELSDTSTDAVNGSQLFATNQAVDALDTRVTQNETDIAANTTAIADLQVTAGNFDNRITQNETDIASLDSRVTVNEGDIANLDTRVAVNEGDITNLDGRVTVNEGDIANLDTRVTTNETDIANLDSRVTVNEGDIANLDTRVTVNEGGISNLDGRVTVNEGDIANLDTRVTTNETNITNIQVQLDNVPVSYVSDADGTTPSAVPTDTAAFVGTSGGTVRVTNVSDADLSATSTDAVNGSQLYATNQQVAQNTSDIATINNSLAGSTVVAVQYSDPDNPTVSNGGTVTNDVTLVGADPSAPVVLHNVANGMLANDAANIGQLQDGLSGVMSASMGYTDQRIADLSFDLSELRDEAFSGTAAAMAMSSIPQAIEANKSLIGGAVGHYRGKTAFGFGYSGVSGDGKMILNARGTIDTDGKGGFSVGAGLSF